MLFESLGVLGSGESDIFLMRVVRDKTLEEDDSSGGGQLETITAEKAGLGKRKHHQNKERNPDGNLDGHETGEVL